MAPSFNPHNPNASFVFNSYRIRVREQSMSLWIRQCWVREREFSYEGAAIFVLFQNDEFAFFFVKERM